MSNNNGNISLFMTSLFTALAPNFRIYAGGKYTTIYFWHLLAVVASIYFMSKSYTDKGYGRHDNEIHYSAMATGLLMGALSRRRMIRIYG
jgi:hypothetical protein